VCATARRGCWASMRGAWAEEGGLWTVCPTCGKDGGKKKAGDGQGGGNFCRWGQASVRSAPARETKFSI